MTLASSWNPVLIWSIGFCSICLLLYICTFKSYLKGLRGTISQLATAVPLSTVSPKARHTSVFAIDLESNVDYHQAGYLRNPTLNLEAIARSEKPKAHSGGLVFSGSLSNVKSKWRTIPKLLIFIKFNVLVTEGSTISA
ncbi:uncharacterized protein LOC131688485 [Topomyia yanbarensis]|uniref:uncharacterized protein LOC131688485 n=1 Tax=Topomyia yanbarensis TaxID=2498891 RepID=UPI00273BC8E3|nr:uncharacterized protein LOC131688485 [Topomyia yanbarensis]